MNKTKGKKDVFEAVKLEPPVGSDTSSSLALAATPRLWRYRSFHAAQRLKLA